MEFLIGIIFGVIKDNEGNLTESYSAVFPSVDGYVSYN